MHLDDLAQFEAANILRPISLERFRSEVFERLHLHCPQVVRRETVEKIMSPDAFDRLLTCRPLQRTWLEIIHANGRVERDDGSNTPTTAFEVSNLVRAGASLRLLNVQNLVEEVAEVSGLLARAFGEAVQANAYFTPAHGSGLSRHFDDHDVWVLQLWGTKRWTLFDRYSNRVELPLPGERFNPAVHRIEGEGCSVTLRAGDFLYLPRGLVHSVRCTDLGSLHLTFGLHGSTYEDLLVQCIREAARKQVRLRQKIAFGSEAVRSDWFSAVRATLKDIFCDGNLNCALDSLIGSGIDRMHSCAPGVISAAIQNVPPKNATILRMRSHRSYHRQKLREGMLLITQHQRTLLDEDEAALIDELAANEAINVATVIERFGSLRAHAFVRQMHALGLIEIASGG